jgi:hypothetical protein
MASANQMPRPLPSNALPSAFVSAHVAVADRKLCCERAVLWNP